MLQEFNFVGKDYKNYELIRLKINMVNKWQ